MTIKILCENNNNNFAFDEKFSHDFSSYKKTLSFVLFFRINIRLLKALETEQTVA
jgi:hypothetical protein